MKKINILGTEYELVIQSSSENEKLEDLNGFCDQYTKQIFITDFEEEKKDKFCVGNIEDLQKQVLRHEIIHAFLGESGLRNCSEWAENEEMVDWMAIQFPRILKTFEEVGAL